MRIHRLMEAAKAASFVSADEETLLIIRREFISHPPQEHLRVLLEELVTWEISGDPGPDEQS